MNSIPNCPSCSGQTELNGQGGILCFFCGFDSGSKMPKVEPSGAGKTYEFLPTTKTPNGRSMLTK